MPSPFLPTEGVLSGYGGQGVSLTGAHLVRPAKAEPGEYRGTEKGRDKFCQAGLSLGHMKKIGYAVLIFIKTNKKEANSSELHLYLL